MKKSGIAVLVALALAVAAAVPALAGEEPGSAYGLRIGYSVNPDQFFFGLQSDLGSIYRDIHFMPGVDAGFGDHLTTIAFNGDVAFFIPLPKSTAKLYALAGPTVMYWDPEHGDGDTEIGLSLGAGARMAFGGSGWYNIEARAGIGDIPDFKILMGLLFGGR